MPNAVVHGAPFCLQLVEYPPFFHPQKIRRPRHNNVEKTGRLNLSQNVWSFSLEKIWKKWQYSICQPNHQAFFCGIQCRRFLWGNHGGVNVFEEFGNRI